MFVKLLKNWLARKQRTLKKTSNLDRKGLIAFVFWLFSLWFFVFWLFVRESRGICICAEQLHVLVHIYSLLLVHRKKCVRFSFRFTYCNVYIVKLNLVLISHHINTLNKMLPEQQVFSISFPICMPPLLDIFIEEYSRENTKQVSKLLSVVGRYQIIYAFSGMI